MKSTPQPYKTN